MNSFLTFHAEATPDGINIIYRSNDGVTECVEAVPYIDVVNRLNVGDYDDKPDEGMSIHLAIADDSNQGCFDYTSQHSVIVWRWLIATVFMLEMRKENDTISIIDDTGNPSKVAAYSNDIAAMPPYPATGCLAVVSDIEGAMIERFGIGSSTERAIIFCRAMTDVERGALTPSGRETFTELHNNFVAELNENGMSAEPATH